MRRRLVREAYEDVVLRTKPVFYVPMQGGSLREVVRMVAATPTNATNHRPGPFAGAAARDFNGTDSKVVVATNAAYHPGDTFSVGGWFRRDGSNANGHALLHNGTGDFVFWINTSNFLTLRRAGTGDIFVSTATYTDTQWMHAIAVKNAGTSAAIYVNGVAIAGTYTNQTVVGAASDPSIGIVSGGGGNPLDGGAAHVAIWNRALPIGEVALLYRAGWNAT